MYAVAIQTRLRSGELLLARSLMGISEAFYLPAALALITDFHTGPTRSRAVGLHQMAIYCGVIVGGFAGYVADAPALGWRSAFDACGLFGMAYALPLAALLRDAPPAGTHVRPSAMQRSFGNSSAAGGLSPGAGGAARCLRPTDAGPGSRPSRGT